MAKVSGERPFLSYGQRGGFEERELKSGLFEKKITKFSKIQNVLRYQSTSAVFKRLHKSKFSKRFCRQLNQFSYKNKLDSFRLYQLVEADLLVCMPATSNHINLAIDEFEQPPRPYILAIPSTKK